MILKIKNADRLLGCEFWDGRFKCIQVHETETNYRFQFDDDKVNSLIHWVEVGKIGHYNKQDNKWFYRLNYQRCGQHEISADWFTDWKNVMETFGLALKRHL